jgi:peroxiredoxin (alkyl hydroperoxide reductase subunit C)
VPDIALSATDGSQIALARLTGRVVVFAYPRTGEPGKPSLVEDWDMIRELGAARRRPAPSATCTRC